MPVIRTAKAADAAAIARVHVDSWRTAYAGIIPQSYLDRLSYQNRASYWRRQLSVPASGWTLVVAEEDGEIVGFAAGGPERSGNKDYSGELGAIYLLEAFQRRGIGRRLVAAMAAGLVELGHTSMLVWVLAGNPASSFYEALGGRPIGRQTVSIAGADLVELGYGWPDIRPLAGTAAPGAASS